MAENSAAATYARYAIIRNMAGLRDAAVARAASVPTATLSDWKSGRYTPKYDKIARISQVLGVDPRLIMEG